MDRTVPGMNQAVMWRLIKEVSRTHACNADYVLGTASMPGTTGGGVMLRRVEICHTDEVFGSTCPRDSRKGQIFDFAIRSMDSNVSAVITLHIEQIQKRLSDCFDGALAGIRNAVPLFRIPRLLSAVGFFLKRVLL